MRLLDARRGIVWSFLTCWATRLLSLPFLGVRCVFQLMQIDRQSVLNRSLHNLRHPRPPRKRKMNVDHVGIMRRVADIAPQMAERAVACDEARQLVSDNMRAMIEAGMFRIP